MTNVELQIEFDLIDAKLIRKRRHNIFVEKDIYSFLEFNTMDEIIDYYQQELLDYKHSPLVSKEYVLLLIELLMFNIKKKHCEVL